MIASSTSLTVAAVGREAPIRFISARGATAKANSRAMVIGRSKGERESRWPSSRTIAPGSRRNSASAVAGVAAGFGLGVLGSEESPRSSKRTDSRNRTPAIPSAIAWWIRAATASRPSASGPITSRVHNGRDRSRWVDISPLTIRHRSFCVAESGVGTRRMWLSISKSTAATQRGFSPSVSTR